LAILDKIKDGTLQASTVKHFISLYPELHNHLSKEITKRITSAQLEKEMPKYATRQAISLFLGTALDSTMTPTSIQSIQKVFLNKPGQQPQQVPNKRSKGAPGKLGKDNPSYRTTTQAAEHDRANRD
jgi:hypothetical protein